MPSFLDKFPTEISGALERGRRILTNTEREFSKLNEPGKIGSNAGGFSGILDYPEDIGESQNLNGHFIKFQVLKLEGLTSDGSTGISGRILNQASVPTTLQDRGTAGAAGTIRGVVGLEDVKYLHGDCIRLYMPEQIRTTYGTDWDLGEVGGASVLGAQSAQDLKNATGSFKDTFDQGVAAFKDIVSAAANTEKLIAGAGELVQALDSRDTLKNSISATLKRIRNPHLEFLFKGVGTRQFQFEFRFNPWNERESDITRSIIESFKFNMHPSKTNTNFLGVFLEYPNIFTITYHSHGVENLWLNKIGRCALVSMDVDYAAAGTSSFLRSNRDEGSPPADTNIPLQFIELDILTQDSMAKGF